MRKLPFWLSIIGVLVLASFVRLYLLGSIPVSLYWDEVAMLVDAKAIAATGHDMHGNVWLQALFPSYGDYKLPVYIWLASLSVKVFGVSEWTVRLPSALAGVATVGVTALMGWTLFSKEKLERRRVLSLFMALGVALAPWSIVFSRTGFEGHVGQFLLALSMLFALRAQKGWGWAVASALMGGLATYTYFSIRFVWPVVFVAAMGLFGLPDFKKYWRQWLMLLVLPLATYVATLWPMTQSPLYAASNQFRLSTTSVLTVSDWPVVSNQYKLEAGNSIFDKLLFHPKILMARELLRNYSDNLSFDFLFLHGDPNLRHGTGQHGLFLWPLLVPFVYGWYVLFAKHSKQALFLAVWWLAALLPASVPETTPHALRSLNALVPLSVVIGWGCFHLWLALKASQFQRWIQTSILVGTGMLLMAVMVDFWLVYTTTYPLYSAKEWQDQYKEIAQEAWNDAEAVDVVWVDPFDARFYLWLMAYTVPVEEFSNIQFENYLPAAIGTIRFRWYDWGKLPTLSEQTVVIARKSEIDWRLETAPYPPSWYKTFYTHSGEPMYAAVYFEKRP